MPRIATIHLLIDVNDDGSACDFCSETFAGMPYVLDWAHARTSTDPFAEATWLYFQPGEYNEGDFLQALAENPELGRR